MRVQRSLTVLIGEEGLTQPVDWVRNILRSLDAIRGPRGWFRSICIKGTRSAAHTCDSQKRTNAVTDKSSHFNEAAHEHYSGKLYLPLHSYELVALFFFLCRFYVSDCFILIFIILC